MTTRLRRAAPLLSGALALCLGWAGASCTSSSGGAAGVRGTRYEAGGDGGQPTASGSTSTGSTAGGPAAVGQAPPIPWTQAFQGDAMLIAEVLEVTGPVGLRDHTLIQQNEAVASYVTRTEGSRLIQELTVRGRERAELRAQLDRWILVAERRIVLIEDARVNEVRIVARGEAYWRDAAGEERRAPVLEFSGER